MRMTGRAVSGVLLAAVVALASAGCASRPTRVSTEVMVCCEADFYRYESYQVRMTNVPGFLEAYLQGGLTAVLNGKGLEPTVSQPDLVVDLIFDQVFLGNGSTEEDYFGEGVAPGDATHFMAAVSVDVTDADTNEIVWSGRLSRIHHDPFGQPRGDDHKMQGIVDAFAELFADYPKRLVDEDREYDN